jgi:hypothetical protein
MSQIMRATNLSLLTIQKCRSFHITSSLMPLNELFNLQKMMNGQKKVLIRYFFRLTIQIDNPESNLKVYLWLDFYRGPKWVIIFWPRPLRSVIANNLFCELINVVKWKFWGHLWLFFVTRDKFWGSNKNWLQHQQI